MPRPLPNPLGAAKGEDPSVKPPLEEWSPIPEREWALRYVHEDGTEDYPGFQQEYMTRYPAMFANNVISYMPPSADHFLRRKPNGRRMDIDHELMALPRSKEEIAEDDRINNEFKRKRRQQLVEQRRQQVEGIRREEGAEALEELAPDHEPIQRPEKLVAVCGAIANQQGKPFVSMDTLNVHQLRCKKCQREISSRKAAETTVEETAAP